MAGTESFEFNLNNEMHSNNSNIKTQPNNFDRQQIPINNDQMIINPTASELQRFISIPRKIPEIRIFTNLSNKILVAGVDSGSPISLIRENSLQKNLKKLNYTWNVGGITGNPTLTKGATELLIFVDNEILSIPVQILPEENTDLNYDILLGADFQDKYGLNVDWREYRISFILNNRNG